MSTGFRRNESDLPSHTFTLTASTDQGWSYRVTFWEEEEQIEAGEFLGKVLLTTVLLSPAHLQGLGREEAPVKPQTVQCPSSREDLWFSSDMKSYWAQALPNYPLQRIDMAPS